MTQDNLLARLRNYAEALSVSETDVVSLKLRPVRPGAQHTDPFGRRDANAYMYGSEYRAGQDACRLVTLDSKLVDRDMHVGHPEPGDSKEFVRAFENAPDMVWIQHETGLEVLGVVADWATMLGILFQAYEAIRGKVCANTTSRETDRYFKEVSCIRVECRRIEKGTLKQDLVVSQELHTPFDSSDLETKVQVVIEGGLRDREPNRERAPRPSDVRRFPDWSSVWATVGVIATIIGVVLAGLFGTAQLLSTRISDVNAGIERVQETLQEDIKEVRDEVRDVDGKVDRLSSEISYIKGRLDEAREDDR